MESPRSLKVGKGSRRKGQKDVMRYEKGATLHCLLCGWKKRPQAKEQRRPLEAGKGKKTDFPQEPPERSAALRTPRS